MSPLRVRMGENRLLLLVGRLALEAFWPGQAGLLERSHGGGDFVNLGAKFYPKVAIGALSVSLIENHAHVYSTDWASNESS
ncbi:hypothetical protein BGW80DRAFT_1275765 [Lactifluus volemus]|nr:hypothetical protein BGW80DRAFT_1275765 [Lactifluus volemus]